MFVITRFRPADPEELMAQAEELLPLLKGCDGLLDARLLRAVDEPGMFALATTWEAAGHYRHALGRMDIRMVLMPMALSALDEPGAFETVLETDPSGAVSRVRSAVVDGPWLSAREAGEGDWVG